ncbi:hypothetical protein L3X38_017305 [Prunus dulcis]|uniref:Uncharacterized protein n=1 Tax=Prunus dulcis TaxID=3755 RepID=A0AAD4ZA09_PRUDU|nr:hypothetical protein L3X38_017305 [Prunus dulcis]
MLFSAANYSDGCGDSNKNEVGGEPYMAEKLWKSALCRILRFAILMSLWDLRKYLVSTAQSVNSTWESLSYFAMTSCQVSKATKPSSWLSEDAKLRF